MNSPPGHQHQLDEQRQGDHAPVRLFLAPLSPFARERLSQDRACILVAVSSCLTLPTSMLNISIHVDMYAGLRWQCLLSPPHLQVPLADSTTEAAYCFWSALEVTAENSRPVHSGIQTVGTRAWPHWRIGAAVFAHRPHNGLLESC